MAGTEVEKFLTIFSTKNGSIFAYNTMYVQNFNTSLTNHIVSFEQVGPNSVGLYRAPNKRFDNKYGIIYYFFIKTCFMFLWRIEEK